MARQDDEMTAAEVQKLLAEDIATMGGRDDRFRNVRVREFSGQPWFDVVPPSGRRFRIRVTQEDDDPEP